MEDSGKEIQVYVIDDQLLICDILCEMIKTISGLSLVGGSTSGIEALEKMCRKKPDIALIDLKLRDENGFELVRTIKERIPGIKILILSGYFNATLVGQAVKYGASGYLTKNLKIDEISLAIKTIWTNTSFYLTEDCGVNLDDVMMEQRLYPGQYAVTRREMEILMLIAREFSTKEISEKLGISEKTVRNHKSHIMQKLNIKSDAGLVKYAYHMAFI